MEDLKMKIDCIVLTYDMLHRKTYDTLCLLKASGYHNVIVWAIPVQYTKKHCPIYEHRPPVNNSISTVDLCDNFNYHHIISKNGYEGLPIDIPILICGAGIIPSKIIKKHMIINAHPGYLPLVRGLDSLKWAIYKGLPIGVTTHILGDEIDAGKIIERRKILIYKNDTFHALAQRVYDNEIQMLVGALKKIDEDHVYISADNNILHKRMNKGEEIRLLECFQRLVSNKGVSTNKRETAILEVKNDK